jgi:hypothetical protein
LVDRDTSREAPIGKATAVTLRFEHAVEIRRLKAFGAHSLRMSTPGARLVAEAGSTEGAGPNGDAGDSEGGTMAASGWQAVELTEPVTAAELTITLEPLGAGAAVREIEVWGAGRDIEPRDIAALATASATSTPTASITP